MTEDGQIDEDATKKQDELIKQGKVIFRPGTQKNKRYLVYYCTDGYEYKQLNFGDINTLICCDNTGLNLYQSAIEYIPEKRKKLRDNLIKKINKIYKRKNKDFDIYQLTPDSEHFWELMYLYKED